MQTQRAPIGHWPASISPDMLAPQKQLLASQWQQHQSRLSALDNEQSRRQAELAGTEEQIKKLTATLPLITERTESLKSLADKQLAVHTIGGVVTPAQQLMVIVPNEEGIEVEAIIQNKDIGFVNEGQIAEVKIDAFPFTKYGTLHAELISVSSDAVQDEKLGLLFTARVLLKQSTMKIEDKIIRLTPGMTVTVEVKTGKRRLIEYVLSPLIQHVSESGRER